VIKSYFAADFDYSLNTHFVAIIKKGAYLVDPVRMRVFRIFVLKERRFFTLLVLLFLAAGIFAPYPHMAMWVGFLFAGYSAIANDSIQTIGTFLASNSKRPWWVLWLFIGGIFLITMVYGWYTYHGDVSYNRLAAKGFTEAPQKFEFLQLAAPLVLLLLTRLRMPVSTTFLCLSAYSTSLSGITGVLQKSMFGYGIAFVASFIVWFIFSKAIRKLTTGKAHPSWTLIQWVTSGFLWSVWLMQDGANIAVTLPRSLSVTELIIFLSYIFFGLGILFYLRGDKIQGVVTKKSEIKDVRGATLIDLIYTIILFIFQQMSNVPMSTTWVFLGLLGGREIAMTLASHYKTGRKMKKTLKLVRHDVFNALIGLIISIIVALLVNEQIRREVLDYLSRF
jgi:hypothetical protein